MNQYLFIIIWILFLGLLYQYMQPASDTLGEKKAARRRILWLDVLLLIVPITICCAVRGNILDTEGYRITYEAIFVRYPSVQAILQAEGKGPGFDILQYYCAKILGRNSTLFFGLLALVQITVLLRFYRRYAPDFWLAVFVFIASADYISWMHNGVRQFLAVALVLFFADYIFEKKYIRMLLVILLATTIHVTAWLMIPIIFIVQGKAWNVKTVLLIFATVIALVALESLTGFVGDQLEETNYEKSFADWQNSNDDGVSPIRVLVYSVPTILSLICLKYIWRADNNVINIACNMGIVSTALYIVAMFTSGIYVGRLPIYCSLFSNGIFLPWVLRNAFSERTYKGLLIAMVICYVAFYCFQSYFVWGLF